jgi:ABC-type branched-subunit amino acid transport system ATPase component
VNGAALGVEGVNFSYGRLQVLFDVTAHVQQGEAIALLGTNGAGKSTLLRVVAGLSAPSAGRVLIDGDDITGRPAEQLVRRGIVLVQGGKGVFSDMTVAENLDVQALTLRGDPRLFQERRELVLSTFPILRQRLSQRAATLSGGEQQQLALAKAVLLGPAVICIDELSLGLAPVVVQELLSIVRAIHRQGTTVILVEQSLNIAADVCERAIFMEKGTVRFEGKTRDLLERDDIARAVFLGSA